MKNFLIATSCLLLFVGCNESKEARIQKLEKQISQTGSQIQDLEQRIETLESNASLNEK